MKAQTKNVIFFCTTIIFVLIATSAFTMPAAPVGHWRTGAGNPLGGIDFVDATNNFLGTDNTNNVGLRLGTFGIDRFFIQDNIAPTAGFIGIGNNFLTPQSLLHLNGTTGEVFRTDAPTLNPTFWRMLRGGNEMGVLFNNAANNNFLIQASQPNSSMLFRTGGPIRRMTITQDNITGQTRVGIGALVSNPQTFLHVGRDAFTTAGFRTWMNVGTYYGIGDDNMYVGLRDISPDRRDAIINWGNNPTGFPAIADRLRFVFTASTGLGAPASGFDGLEIARMVSDATTGKMGIGDFFTAGIDPQEKLHVLGADGFIRTDVLTTPPVI